MRDTSMDKTKQPTKRGGSPLREMYTMLGKQESSMDLSDNAGIRSGGNRKIRHFNL